jgi:hypothetical protein
MNGSLFEDIAVLDPEQAEKEKQVKSQGFQHYRDCVLRTMASLTFSEKFKIIKKVDRDILTRVNTYQGTKAVHTLNYLHRIPSRKQNLTKIDEIVLILRSLYVVCARNDYYKERRKKMIRVVK